MRKYLAILMIKLLVLVDCARVSHPPQTIISASSFPSSLPVSQSGNFRVIDEKNPPKSGIWMPWDDAKTYANRLQNERVEWRKYVYRQQRDLEIEKARRKMSEQSAMQYNDPYSNFFMTWGFPLGFGLGMIAGISALIAVNSNKR